MGCCAYECCIGGSITKSSGRLTTPPLRRTRARDILPRLPAHRLRVLSIPSMLPTRSVAYILLALVVPRLQAQHATIPTPESSLGFTVGADFKLATYDESIAYFQKLAAASNRIRLVDVGKTSTGHPWTLAIISSPENLAKLDRLKEISQRLAHPTGLTDAEARHLATEGRVFVDI